MWIYLGNKFSKKSPAIGFWFLCIYMAFSTHACVAVVEKKSGYIPYRTESINLLDKIDSMSDSEYAFNLIETKDGQFIRVNPWSDNFILFFSYNVYRFLLGNSSYPQQIYDEEGYLVDWTTDEMDDPPYQNKWSGARFIKDLSKHETISFLKS